MLIKVFELTVLVIIILVFINIILKELKERKEIIRLFNSILVISYIVTIILVSAYSITISAIEDTKNANEVIIELK